MAAGAQRPAARHHRQRQDLCGVAGHAGRAAATPSAGAGRRGLQVLWLTPMRALAADTTRALPSRCRPGAGWTVGQRTGDTPAPSARGRTALPTVLVTTPESLSADAEPRDNARDELAGVHTVVVDEWHELIGNKRGVQVQLALARLRRWNPRWWCGGCRPRWATWRGHAGAGRSGDGAGSWCKAASTRPWSSTPCCPPTPAVSWGGHLGAQMQQPVVDEIAAPQRRHTLVFTNVRSQAEIWYQLLLERGPTGPGLMALHHGSLDKGVREWVEQGLKAGTLKAVVATSSAWTWAWTSCRWSGCCRSARPRAWRGCCSAPAAAATRRGGQPHHAGAHQHAGAGGGRRRAPRRAGRAAWSAQSPDKPLDVLVQHLVTRGAGRWLHGRCAVRRGAQRPAYRDLPRGVRLGAGLCRTRRRQPGAYPEYHRVCARRRPSTACPTAASRGATGCRWAPSSATQHAGQVGQRRHHRHHRRRLHRPAEQGRLLRLCGPVLEYVRTQDMAAYVRKAKKPRAWCRPGPAARCRCPVNWREAVQALLDGAAQGRFEPEMQAAAAHAGDTQARLSHLPRLGTLLVEQLPLARRPPPVRLPVCRPQRAPGAGAACWPGGCRGRSPTPFRSASTTTASSCWPPSRWTCRRCSTVGAFPPDLLADVLASLNSGELAQRRFREIARVAGLVFGGYPGAPKSLRQLQASSSLFYEVFRKYDAGNRLLAQAELARSAGAGARGRRRPGPQGPQRAPATGGNHRSGQPRRRR
jgi:ATP-dependent Lhr-like helicase